MDVVDVQTTVNVLHAPVDVRPTENVLIVKDRPRRIVAANPPVEVSPPGPDVIRRDRTIREVVSD